MKTFAFIRHGESTANAAGMVVSEFLRTHQTALPFCDQVSTSVIHSALNEFSCLESMPAILF